MAMDSTTEAIAHFAGLFSLVVEAQRGRMDYDKFRAEATEARENKDLPNVDVVMRAPHELKGFDPHVNSTAPPVDLFPVYIPVPVWAQNFYRSPIHISQDFGPIKPLFITPFLKSSFSISFEVPPLPSFVVLVHQINRLTDNDYLSFVDGDVETISLESLQAGREWLESKSDELDPIGALSKPASIAGIAEIIDGVVEAMEDGAGQPGAYLVARGEAVEGVHVNGEAVDEAPKLSDYLSSEEDSEDEQEPAEEETTTQELSEPAEHASGNQLSGEGEIQPVPFMELEAGGNRLVNEANIASAWTDAAVFATMGSAVSINVISQTNVWYDSDSLNGVFAGVENPLDAATEAFNVATFKTEPTEQDTGLQSTDFPQFWSVTRMEGDVVLLNWLEQINLVSDNDVTVLTETGTQTYVQVGGNLSVNAVSLFEIGSFYDAVIIGGNMYNANIISQSNILMDGDYLSSTEDFSTAWTGQLATQGNLLWNQANITSYGETTYDSMPDAFAQTGRKLQNGKDELAPGLLGDDHFAGMGALSVLYIEGDLFDLKYISQKNVLGDADQIVMVEDDLEGYAKSEFQLDTGGNELINIASIFDAGFDSTVYAGGDVYAESFLYQSEFISNDPLAAAQNPHALANEAVVFLAEGLLGPEDQQSPDAPIKPIEPEDPGQADILQTMLA